MPAAARTVVSSTDARAVDAARAAGLVQHVEQDDHLGVAVGQGVATCSSRVRSVTRQSMRRSRSPGPNAADAGQLAALARAARAVDADHARPRAAWRRRLGTLGQRVDLTRRRAGAARAADQQPVAGDGVRGDRAERVAAPAQRRARPGRHRRCAPAAEGRRERPVGRAAGAASAAPQPDHDEVVADRVGVADADADGRPRRPRPRIGSRRRRARPRRAGRGGARRPTARRRGRTARPARPGRAGRGTRRPARARR